MNKIKAVCSSFVLSILLMAAQSLQGVDFTDEGFWASIYQNILSDPISVQYGFMYWLTGIVGGVWNYLFPSLGLWGFRLLNIILQAAVLLLVVRMLWKHVSALALCMGMIVCTALMSYEHILSFYGNTFSMFLLMSAIFSCWRYTETRHQRWLIVAGVISGIAPFARVPNISFVAVLAIPIVGNALNKSSQFCLQSFFDVARYIGGFLLGALLMIGIMFGLNHHAIFLEMLQMLSAMARQGGDSVQAHHSCGELLKLQVHLYGFSIGLLGFLAIAEYISGKILNSFSLNVRRFLWLVAVTVATIICGFVTYHFSAMRLICYLAVAIGGLSLIYECLAFTIDSRRALLWCCAFLLMTVLPLGSGAPIGVLKYGFWLMVPLSFDVIYSTLKRDFSEKNYKIVLPVAVPTVVILFSLVFAWSGSYRDSAHRERLRAPIPVPRLAGVFTTKERSAEIVTLCAALRKFTTDKEELIVYADMPLVYFLMNRRPPLRNPWLKLYPPEELQSKLEREIIGKKKTSVVVRQKNKVGLREWPNERISYLNAPSNYQRNIVLEKYLHDNHFALVWENVDFDLWKQVGIPCQ